MARDPGIYVEISICSTVDEIWRRTQTPELHAEWDLRFASIEYLPRASEAEPQRFLYSTRIGFGLSIDGVGESTGTRADASGSRTSALSFWSDDPKSLISKGSGYWSYVPGSTALRFLTWYDYSTRYGLAGKIIDRAAFRPLIGWATAWSFDRLRLWIERGISPETSMKLAVIHGIARACVAFIWVWQGLVPKLLFPSGDEKLMLNAAGASSVWLPAVGVAEVLLGIVGILFWRWRGFFVVNLVVMIAALVDVAFRSPGYLVSAFNPVTLNFGVIGLSCIGYLAGKDLPSAARCIRRRLQ